MKAKLSFARYQRPLSSPFLYGARSLEMREGFLLRATSEQRTIFAEAAPLPGHSLDCLNDVAHALEKNSADALLAEDSSELPSLPAALRFALDGLKIQEQPFRNPVQSNALLRWAGHNGTRERLRELVLAGYKTIKIKINAQSSHEVLDLVAENPDLRFRLDANQGLDVRQTVTLVNKIIERSLLRSLDYLEEPFAGAWDCPALRGSPLALAADESAPGEEAIERILDLPTPPAVFIIKPTVAGGLTSIEPILRKLWAAEKRIVFTSALETEIGRRAIIAHVSQGPFDVCGLATGHLFQVNHLEDQPHWEKLPSMREPENEWLSHLLWKELK